MPIKEPDPVYKSGVFPLDGCKIEIEILAKSYRVIMYPPGSQGGDHITWNRFNDSDEAVGYVRHLLDKSEQTLTLAGQRVASGSTS